VFYISLLELAPKHVRATLMQLEDTQENVYKVEKVLDKQELKEISYYLIKWSGYNILENI
jgi:Chromo (CHRromatin Organisation MOdifier) domain